MLGSILSAAANVIGGFASQNDNQDFQSSMADRNAALQREFAQHGVRWRVADAQAAGIHPLFALGMQPIQASPSMVGGDSSLFEGLSRAGQDIGRAIDSTRTEDERVNSRMEALALERSELQNELLRSQIARMNQQATPPTPGDNYLIPGQTSSGLIEQKPLEVIAPNPGRLSQEPGALSDVGFIRTDTGLKPVPGKDAKERIEDNLIEETLWSLRNTLLPRFLGGQVNKPPHGSLPPGAYDWRWNPLKLEWQAVFPGENQDMQGRTIRLAD